MISKQKLLKLLRSQPLGLDEIAHLADDCQNIKISRTAHKYIVARIELEELVTALKKEEAKKGK